MKIECLVLLFKNYWRTLFKSFDKNPFRLTMAEWGKGDPRWIVEERPDGKIFRHARFHSYAARVSSIF
jgi:hypothetical protein